MSRVLTKMRFISFFLMGVLVASQSFPNIDSLATVTIAEHARSAAPVELMPKRLEWVAYITVICMYILTVAVAVRTIGNKSGLQGNAAMIVHIGAATTSIAFECVWLGWAYQNISTYMFLVVSVVRGTSMMVSMIGMSIVVRRALDYHVTGCMYPVWIELGAGRGMVALMWLVIPETFLLFMSHLWHIKWFKGTLNDMAYHTWQLVMIGIVLLNGGGFGALQLLVLSYTPIHFHFQLAVLITTVVTIISRIVFLWPFLSGVVDYRSHHVKDPWCILMGRFSHEFDVILDLGLDCVPPSDQVPTNCDDSLLTPLFAYDDTVRRIHPPVDMFQFRDAVSDTTSNQSTRVLEKY